MNATRRAFYHLGRNTSGLFLPENRGVTPDTRMPAEPSLPVSGALIWLRSDELAALAAASTEVDAENKKVIRQWSDHLSGIPFINEVAGLKYNPGWANGLDAVAEPCVSNQLIDEPNYLTAFLVGKVPVNQGKPDPARRTVALAASSPMLKDELAFYYSALRRQHSFKEGTWHTTVDSYLLNPTPAYSGLELFSFQYNIDAEVRLSMRINGVDVAVAGINSVSDGMVASQLSLMGYTITPGFNGYDYNRPEAYTAEFVYYPRALSLADIQAVEAFLMAKFKL
jgi:hypothetical protein